MSSSSRRLLAALIVAAATPAFAQAPPSPVLPLTLRDVLMQAYAGAPVGQEATAAVDVERGRLAQARLRPNPELSVSVDQFAGSGPLSGTRQAESTAALALPIELGGKRAARVAIGEAVLTGALARLTLTRLDLARAVREAYAAAHGAQALEALARDEAALAAEIERTVRLLVEGGREPPLRLVTATVERANADAAVAVATGEAAAARARLAALIGRSDTAFTLADPVIQAAGTSAAPPDLAAADADVARARAQLRLERSLRTPDPRLTFGVRRLSAEGANALVAGVAMPLPLFNRNRGAIAAAAAEQRRADAARLRAGFDLEARARAASARVEADRARLAALDGAAIPGAAEALRIARAGFAAGKFPFLELLNAQRAFAAARRSRVEAVRDLAVAEAERDRAAGIAPYSEINP